MDDDVFEALGWVAGQFAVEADVMGAVIATAPACFHFLDECFVDVYLHDCRPAVDEIWQCGSDEASMCSIDEGLPFCSATFGRMCEKYRVGE